jgi:4-hydroxybenzoate polyprenyltransferase
LSTTSLQAPRSIISHLRLYLALSRTPHGLLDMTTPAVAAILWYGALPSFRITLMGIITSFAGYTAVYALNDLIDYRADKKRYDEGLHPDMGSDVDSVFVRHPMACGLLSFRNALLWTAAWSILALAGAYQLNPLCMAIFLAACALESIYCLLWRSGWLKILVSGAVKTSGAMAAVFAVDSNPSLSFLFLLFMWLFFWEIGGQNLPNDWADIEEDTILRATTVPVQFGTKVASTIILVSIICAISLNLLLFGLSPGGRIPFLAMAASFFAGVYLLLVPALRLYRTGERADALLLFNKASFYPASILAVVGAGMF